ncbi:hypothetical protein ANCCAN_09276 [Ancylostoma caninum]|uniref:DNA-directed RNA polymerase n=1 Tax=Ancylostoma caninum TaxID=29170 RepID=A0A368GJY2_ANCCA|nr:hypothetical protein ANCCAN_09276 [Ancylostoma caninum]
MATRARPVEDSAHSDDGLRPEMNNVFAVYGIEVSKRHLSLTADYMTFTGEIAPFNRAAMSSSSSPLQKMTFETTMAFMKEALLHGMFWGS